jgi:alanine racemase
MSNASESDFTQHQLEQFNIAVADLADNNIRPEILHPAKSSGGLYYPEARFDMVRLGIAAYGVPPANDRPLPMGIHTAFTWHARVTASKILPAGAGVSYSREYIMPLPGRVGIVPVGYADGFRRTPKNINSVLVNGRECKVLGRVNMDQIMIDLGDMPDMTGAEAVLLGKQGEAEISVQELAKRWNTNSYDVMTGTALRVPRKIKP